jgi:3-oxoadipate:acetyl-CoA acetyltransferase
MNGEQTPLIINAALTGMIPTKDDNPAVPITPDEIADDAQRCVEAGATIVHLHARDEDGRPTYRKEVYAEIIQAVRERCPEVIVCVSTSGRTFKTLDERADVLELEGNLKPELASLTLGSLNFPQQASVNEPQMINDLAERMNERGIVPELEVFDFGMVDYAKFLLARDVIRRPLLFNLLLGSLGTLSASAVNLATLAASLPEGSTWAGAGIGRSQFFVNGLAIAMGAHVRVGLEDNVWLDTRKERLASNPELVDRLARLARALERKIATPDQARSKIGLPARTLSPIAR